MILRTKRVIVLKVNCKMMTMLIMFCRSKGEAVGNSDWVYMKYMKCTYARPALGYEKFCTKPASWASREQLHRKRPALAG
jgi:hypothetical protein